MENQKEKIKRVYSQLQLISQLILHSMGQYIQDGSRNLFETVINVEKAKKEVVIEENSEDTRWIKLLSWKNYGFC